MKFLAFLALFFGLSYTLLAAHYLSFDHKAKQDELREISKSGLEEILILTGESETNSSVAYIANACALAKKFFKVVGVEIYPLNSVCAAFVKYGVAV